ncbi:FtsX-like permease family protein [bacterium]|nr:FtsX-like permease family protein [bacterium]
MLAFKLALRNLFGAGLRTWLTVIVLSFSYVIIIFQQGMLDGWNKQARRDMMHWELGGGQYWHTAYDPYDFFTIEDGRGPLAPELQSRVDQGQATDVLISQASIYPDGRLMSVLLKGIDPNQTILDMPTAPLVENITEIPALIGRRMAEAAKLRKGDVVTVRWRDANGTFDATEIKIVEVMKTNVGSIDMGQLWLPKSRLESMLGVENMTTYLVLKRGSNATDTVNGWVYRDHAYLMKELTEMIKMKSVGGSIMFLVLLALAWLAIFDTQVLSIFRRRKEIGTMIALGMTRQRVVRIFTLEGAMHGILAAAVAALYGAPLFIWMARSGWAMPEMTDDMGMAIAERIYPSYSLGLIAMTTAIVMLSVIVVSFIPARNITTFNPTDAIKGKTS